MCTNLTAYRAAAAALLLLAARPATADEPAAGVTTYPASHFHASRPQTAFDMLALTPGYTFSDSDPDVRGLAGAAGNVLLDGDLPATKHDSLEALLRRIPASAVARIELIRAGARGVEMYGHALLANIVRVRSARTHGAVELESTFYGHDPLAPRIAADWSRDSDAARVELSAAAYRELGDEHGRGVESRRSPAGEPLGGAALEHKERDRALELSAAYERRSTRGKLAANAALVRERAHAQRIERGWFPDLEREDARELEREREAELGVQYEHAISESIRWEALGLYRTMREDEAERSIEGEDEALSHELARAREAIVRTLVRRSFERWTWEAGVEAVRNVLDGRSTLRENGVDAHLPAANVRVEERRGEAFAAGSWRPSARWTLEVGMRFEASELSHDAEGDARNSFAFAKPRVLAAYTVSPVQRWRVSAERRVGQLDFGDFVSSASLADDAVTAGNPDLEPERAWVYELGWEAEFGKRATLGVAARRERISHVVDRIVAYSAGGAFDAVGNIGAGVRDELELSASMPLRALGLESAMVKATVLWRDGRVHDPATGAVRAISGDAPFEGALAFTHDLTAHNVRWGVDAALASKLREYRIDEVRTDRTGAEVDVFLEYTPAPAWSVRVQANNIADREFERERRRYAGVRGVAALESIETRTLRLGRSISVSVRRSFGR